MDRQVEQTALKVGAAIRRLVDRRAELDRTVDEVRAAGVTEEQIRAQLIMGGAEIMWNGCPRSGNDLTPCAAREGRLGCDADGYCADCHRHPADILVEVVTRYRTRGEIDGKDPRQIDDPGDRVLFDHQWFSELLHRYSPDGLDPVPTLSVADCDDRYARMCDAVVQIMWAAMHGVSPEDLELHTSAAARPIARVFLAAAGIAGPSNGGALAHATVTRGAPRGMPCGRVTGRDQACGEDTTHTLTTPGAGAVFICADHAEQAVRAGAVDLDTRPT